MKTALIQFNAGSDQKENVSHAADLVEQAALMKAELVLLPEVFSFRGNMLDAAVLAEALEDIPGKTTGVFQDIARRHGVTIVLGSLIERSAGKPYNTSIVISAQGQITARYRKIHLFDAVIDGKIIREKDLFGAGQEEALFTAGEFSVGLSICYDLRFPDLYRQYANKKAHVLSVPSCFTRTTGEAHWEVLLRARAIENLSYVLAPNQVGRDARGVLAHGHSMVIDPWGVVVAQASGDKEEIIVAELSMETIKKARAKLPGIVKE